MLTVTKRSGEEQEFRVEKLENSMRKAGVSTGIAKLVTSCISYHYRRGMTTVEIRDRVVAWIRDMEPHAALLYESHPEKTLAK